MKVYRLSERGRVWVAGAFLSVMVWTFIFAAIMAMVGCSIVPNQRPEEFRVPIKSYITVESTKVCSATDGKTTMVWGCK